MRRVLVLLFTLLFALGWATPSRADSFTTSVTAEPAISGPPTATCAVTLVNNQPFGLNFNTHPATGTVIYTGSYTPACGTGPWAKVVLTWSGTVDAGRQFDRIGALWMGGNELLRTSTPEPSAAAGVQWNVTKDVTEYSALFGQSQTITAQVPNYITGPYTSTIHITATLTFYAATASYPAPSTPDAVIPIAGSDPSSPWFTVSDGTPVGATVTIPTNARQAYLEVYATPHSCDEFWYGNPPPSYNSQSGACGTGAFQEIQVLVDGHLAGLAAPFPVIYTGGVNPYLWRPIPGVEAFNIRPYVVNLTPFVGQLADGQQHSIQIAVPNASSFWLVDGDLLLTEGAGTTTGGVDSTTTPAATVSVTQNITQNGATFGTTASHTITITGHTTTPDGTTTTTIQQSLSFSDSQVWNLVNLLENLKTSETFSTATTTTSPDGHTTVHTVSQSFPLSLSSALQVPQRGSATEFILPATVDQTYQENVADTRDGASTFSSSLDYTAHAEAVLIRSLSTGQNQVANGHTTEQYVYSDSTGACYNHFLAAAQGSVTADTLKSKC